MSVEHPVLCLTTFGILKVWQLVSEEVVKVKCLLQKSCSLARDLLLRRLNGMKRLRFLNYCLKIDVFTCASYLWFYPPGTQSTVVDIDLKTKEEIEMTIKWCRDITSFEFIHDDCETMKGIPNESFDVVVERSVDSLTPNSRAKSM